MNAGADGFCQWFLLCRNEATGTLTHPILGDVPICERCRAKDAMLGREEPASPQV